MTTPAPALGHLTIRFRDGSQSEPVLTSAADYEMAVAAVNAGEPFRVTVYDMGGREAGAMDVAPGAAVALTFRA